MVKRWSPDAVAAPVGPYSHLASAPAGHEIVFVSGQIGALDDGTLAEDVASQTTQALTNVHRLLASVGAEPASIVKLLTLVAGADHLAAARAALGQVLQDWYPAGDWPAHSLAVVTALASPEIRVEIEAVAAVAR